MALRSHNGIHAMYSLCLTSTATACPADTTVLDTFIHNSTLLYDRCQKITYKCRHRVAQPFI